MNTHTPNPEQSESAPPTAGNINDAIRWLRANEQAISLALPIETPGVCYQAGWLDRLNVRVQQWEAGDTPLNLAVCYILLPLRAIKKILATSLHSK